MSLIFEGKRVAFYTLGCKLNFSETSALTRKFEDIGFRKVEFSSLADVYVINTCTVTEHADKKCRNAIYRAVKTNPDAFVAVIGCYSQLKADEISKIPGVSLVLGSANKLDISHFVENFSRKGQATICQETAHEEAECFSAYSSGDRTRSFLKIQDGCDFHCSYCTVCIARGKSRNMPISQVVKEANEIAEKGIKEIVLAGVNLGDFGKSTGETFFQLIQALDEVEGIERYRISSIEPNLLTPEIIRFVADSKKFLPHFHIPLQSGCDRILALMRRRYNTAFYRRKIEEIKAVMPDAGIGMDVIVGFPGETDEDFKVTYNFIKSLNISYLHVFPYSIRENTPAASYADQVPYKIKDERNKKLHELSEQKRHDFYLKNLGSRQKVLFEGQRNKGKIHGFTANYIKVEAPYDAKLAGKIFTVKLKDISPEGDVIFEHFVPEPQKL